MPVKQTPADTRIGAVRAGILEKVAELFDKHSNQLESPNFLEFLEEAEEKKLNLTFTAKIDLTESKGHVDVVIGYSQAVKDKRGFDLDDPNQGQLPMTQPIENGRVISVDMTGNVSANGEEGAGRKPKKAKRQTDEAVTETTAAE